MSDGKAVQVNVVCGKIKARYDFHVDMQDRCARIRDGNAPPEPKAEGRVPRISRLLALAHHIRGLVDSGKVRNYAEVARRGHVTRARISQIMNLLFLAPDIQESILYFPRVTRGGDPITERDVRPLCRIADWRKQRVEWRAIIARRIVREPKDVARPF